MNLNTLKDYTNWLLKWFGICSVVGGVISMVPFHRDDSDLQGWGAKRSGMKPLTDNLTGCQYLTTSSGITPRLSADGKVIGCR